MADFACQQSEIGLELVRLCFTERNNFREGSSGPKKDAQRIQVPGRQPLYYFHFDFRYVTLDIYIYIYIYIYVHNVYMW